MSVYSNLTRISSDDSSSVGGNADTRSFVSAPLLGARHPGTLPFLNCGSVFIPLNATPVSAAAAPSCPVSPTLSVPTASCDETASLGVFLRPPPALALFSEHALPVYPGSMDDETVPRFSTSMPIALIHDRASNNADPFDDASAQPIPPTVAPKPRYSTAIGAIVVRAEDERSPLAFTPPTTEASVKLSGNEDANASQPQEMALCKTTMTATSQPPTPDFVHAAGSDTPPKPAPALTKAMLARARKRAMLRARAAAVRASVLVPDDRDGPLVRQAMLLQEARAAQAGAQSVLLTKPVDIAAMRHAASTAKEGGTLKKRRSAGAESVRRLSAVTVPQRRSPGPGPETDKLGSDPFSFPCSSATLAASNAAAAVDLMPAVVPPSSTLAVRKTAPHVSTQAASCSAMRQLRPPAKAPIIAANVAMEPSLELSGEEAAQDSALPQATSPPDSPVPFSRPSMPAPAPFHHVSSPPTGEPKGRSNGEWGSAAAGPTAMLACLRMMRSPQAPVTVSACDARMPPELTSVFSANDENAFPAAAQAVPSSAAISTTVSSAIHTMRLQRLDFEIAEIDRAESRLWETLRARAAAATQRLTALRQRERDQAVAASVAGKAAAAQMKATMRAASVAEATRLSGGQNKAVVEAFAKASFEAEATCATPSSGIDEPSLTVEKPTYQATPFSTDATHYTPEHAPGERNAELKELLWRILGPETKHKYSIQERNRAIRVAQWLRKAEQAGADVGPPPCFV